MQTAPGRSSMSRSRSVKAQMGTGTSENRFLPRSLVEKRNNMAAMSGEATDGIESPQWGVSTQLSRSVCNPNRLGYPCFLTRFFSFWTHSGIYELPHQLLKCITVDIFQRNEIRSPPRQLLPLPVALLLPLPCLNRILSFKAFKTGKKGLPWVGQVYHFEQRMVNACSSFAKSNSNVFCKSPFVPQRDLHHVFISNKKRLRH